MPVPGSCSEWCWAELELGEYQDEYRSLLSARWEEVKEEDRGDCLSGSCFQSCEVSAVVQINHWSSAQRQLTGPWALNHSHCAYSIPSVTHQPKRPTRNKSTLSCGVTPSDRHYSSSCCASDSTKWCRFEWCCKGTGSKSGYPLTLSFCRTEELQHCVYCVEFKLFQKCSWKQASTLTKTIKNKIK